MATFRAFYKNKRLATGKDYKNNTFLQVYPTLKEFENRTEWIMAWYNAYSQDVSFVREEKKIAAPPAAAPPSAPAPALAPPRAPSPPPSSRDWSYRKELTYTAPAGTYYIGDLCYALHEDIYDNVFGGRAYESGFYSKGPSFFMVDNTAYGDGSYEGSDGYPYAVDAGIIGICSADLIDPNNRSVSGGKIHSFKEPVEVRFKGGVFYFTSGYTHLTINTQGEEYDDEDDY